MVATISAPGAPSTFTKSFSRVFSLPKKPTVLTNFATTCENSKDMACFERDGSRYAYRLTSKGIQVALLFLFFHKRLCGPLANSRFHYQPEPIHRPESKLEA